MGIAYSIPYGEAIASCNEPTKHVYALYIYRSLLICHGIDYGGSIISIQDTGPKGPDYCTAPVRLDELDNLFDNFKPKDLKKKRPTTQNNGAWISKLRTIIN